MQTQNCFLLSYLKYGDNDAVLHCFSLENGFQSFFAKGIYSARNKMKPYLFPLNLLNITVSKVVAENRIPRISKIELAPDHYDFDEVTMNSILFFTADFLHQVLREEGKNLVLFNQIETVRKEISIQNYDAYLVFIFKFLSISGVAPLYGDQKFLNPESGVFEDAISHPFFDESISALWKRFSNTTNGYEIRLKRDDRSSFLDSLMIYCRIHINGFYTPNSLAVVRQIFE
ncbi:DNA repair protein RecO [Kaistella flava (ex Peng et al. 2021)]|uniref:DNA repair protein RecO n=1 Tax=Kaistella flava (ex Peng et al. 2021) TaxID=2038776 RepID=A0A7M2YCM8_9FLAO|nr:recombination protein O N-terminal domain-containing protein [Kaistella flava (ex Peng et al. 2021)]QOW11800.1 DNA repair protein RecO [Kaistella flava (ex Peng et al. 2021)]